MFIRKVQEQLFPLSAEERLEILENKVDQNLRVEAAVCRYVEGKVNVPTYKDAVSQAIDHIARQQESHHLQVQSKARLHEQKWQAKHRENRTKCNLAAAAVSLAKRN